MNVALAHDYCTQRGGAERTVLAMLRTFPGAPLYTSLYEPELTYDELGAADVRCSPLNRSALLRRHHRLALPLLAPAWSRTRIDADVVVCSSSGWAHGANVAGRKIVYCHTPARWLYQSGRYLGGPAPLRRAALLPLRAPLRRWDRAAAASAHLYVANSRAVRDRIRAAYGLDAEVVPPPFGVASSAPRRPPDGIEPGFYLCVSRLLSYKNVAAVARAFAGLPAERLVVVGEGPEASRLRASAPPNVVFTGAVAEPELRWLYAESRGLVAASYEDFGLTPLEAAAFGKPTAALRFGGYLDTVEDGRTGVFFDTPDAAAILRAVQTLAAESWDAESLRRHAEGFSEARFAARLRELVAGARA